MKTHDFKFLTATSIIGLTFTFLSSPAFGFDLTINPPPSLTIDNMPISEGVFDLTNVMEFFIDTNNQIDMVDLGDS